MNKQIYAAYGSNLNISQMADRCPTAKLVGKGIIQDFALQFKGFSTSVFATIAPENGSSVPVAVWELEQRDVRALDCYEGYPSHYFKQDISVQFDNGKEIQAMAYLMNLNMNFGIPSVFYYRMVYQGYLDCGLNTDVLVKALKDSAQKWYASVVHTPSAQIGFLHGEKSEQKYDEEEPDLSAFFCSSDEMQWNGL